MTEALVTAARKGGLQALRTLLQLQWRSEDLDGLGPTSQNALHLAVWRNHAGLAAALLEAGANPDARDGESGWTPLHKALYWGHLCLAAQLLAADANLSLADWRGRGALDLLSQELQGFLAPGPGDVFSWGSGSNYTLGTGSTDVELDPTRLEGLHDAQACLLSAAKFHSAAVTQEGQLYTWGWGRGGRLGHPEAHIHSGESAVITPRLVSALGRRAVAAVAAAKHHTVLCTTAGEVFTFGRNRHGQLGYAVDTQPTPKRVAALRQRVVAVAAANKHSVAVTAAGEVFTWGGNAVGQLGYGSVDSTSNASPRLVEAMKGRRVVAAAAAKRHTLVLTAEGEVYTWGHRGVSPRRVVLAGSRDTANAGGEPLRFHRGHSDVARPVAMAICAGAAHSTVLTSAGVVLTWRSADPALQVQEVLGPLAGKRCVSISAGKYRTAVVTEQGDVYCWEGRSDYFPADGRQSGSGSKKAQSRGRPIPPRTLGLMSEASGSQGSPGAPDTPGSYGSHSRRGSHFERFAAERDREREFGGASSLGVRGATPPSARATPAKGTLSTDTFGPILPVRVEGLKRVVHVAVGEKHSLAVQRWAAAQLPGLPHMPWLDFDQRAAGSSALHDDGSSVYSRAADGEDSSGQLSTPRSELSAEPSSSESPGTARPGGPVFSPVRPGGRRRQGMPGEVGVPSLQRMCEEVVAQHLVDPRTTLQILEYADVAGASMLRSYCLSVALCNLDAVLLEARGAFEDLAPHLLGELERLWKLRLAGAGVKAEEALEQEAAEAGLLGVEHVLQLAPEPAGPEELEDDAAAAGARPTAVEAEAHKPAAPERAGGSILQPGRRPTAAPASLGQDEEQEAGSSGLLAAGSRVSSAADLGIALSSESSFRDHSEAHAEAAAGRLLRTLQKKLQQIESLEERAAGGAALDAQQLAKVRQRPVLLAALQALAGGMAVEEVQSIIRAGIAAEEGSAAEASRPGSTAGSSSASKPPKSVGKAKGKGSAKKAASQHAPQQQQPESQPGATAGEELAAELSGLAISGCAAPAPATQQAGLFGSSPPASALLPAFGLGEQPRAGMGAGVEAMSPVHTQVGFTAQGGLLAAAAEPPRSSGKAAKAKRTGGLSMFLRGELDAAAAAPAPGPSSAPAGPAWGGRGTATPPSATSLREILAAGEGTPSAAPRASSTSKAPASGAKQGGTPGSASAATRSRSASLADASPSGPPSGGPVRMSLASFMQQTSPLVIQQQQQQQQKAAGPAWGGVVGASPPTRGSSLLAIQEEQQKAATAALPPPRSHGSSPPASRRLTAGLPPWRAVPADSGPAGGGSTAGGTSGGATAAATALLGTSPTGSSIIAGTSPSGRSSFSAAPRPSQSKWYVPDERRAAQKSLAAIQAEEKAVSELAKRYGSANVRIVTKQARPPGLPAARPQAQAGQGQQ